MAMPILCLPRFRIVWGGQATLGLDDAHVVKRVADGSCEGRSLAAVAAHQEALGVLLPDPSCSPQLPVQVESATARSIALIEPDVDGLPGRVVLGDVSLTLSNYKLNKNKLKITYANGGEAPITESRSIKAASELEAISKRYQLLQATGGSSAVQYRNQNGELAHYNRSAELGAGEFAVSDALAYGTQVNSWAACTISEFLDDLEEAAQLFTCVP